MQFGLRFEFLTFGTRADLWVAHVATHFFAETERS
jgi:hypothetical protein